MTAQLITKALVSGIIIAVVSELAKKDNLVASIVHSLPLTSLLVFIWMFIETKDAAKIGAHAYGTFWFVLPTLPMFLFMPWLIRTLGGFWPAFGAGIAGTIGLYFLTMRLLDAAGVKF